MTKEQINKLEMYQAVQTYLDTDTNKWSGVPVLLTFKNELDELLIQLRENSDTQEANRIFLGANKTTQKRFVSEKADILNDALEAYAAVEGVIALEQKAAKSFSDLYKLRNQDFITVITETITLLEEHIKTLSYYGVTKDQVTDLKNSFDHFLILQRQPRQYRIAGKQATLSLAELFTSTSNLLTQKMDKVFKRFKRADATLYNGYLAARTIVNN
ncbi:hypothetical protein ABW636_11365 [Aquimarina sp. 2201CG1-2-11]|uniref:hypothetical protein n=1 Tax=Aquimarina discodermiae TaxID=3231043 RepID=UPI003461BB82